MILEELKKKYVSTSLSWLLVSNIIKSVSQWALLIVLIKFFNDEDVGYYTYGLAIASPVFMLSEMQLKSVYVVEPDNTDCGFPIYNFIRLISVVIATGGLILYCILKGKVNWIVFYVILYKAIESLIDILYGYLQRKDLMVWMSKIDIIKSILTLFLCFCCSLIFNSILAAIIGTIIASCILYFVDYRYIIKYTHPQKCSITLKKIVDVLKKGLPLGISVLFSSYITNYPRIIVENQMGPDMLAYFGAYSYLAIGIFQIQIPVQTYLRQKLSVNYQNKDIKKYRDLFSKAIISFIIFGGICLAGMYIAGKPIISLLYKPSYVEYDFVLYWLIIAQLLSSIAGLYSIAVLTFNIYTKQVFITFFSFMLVFVTSKWAIGTFGLLGASIESVAASLISLISYVTIYLRRIRNER